MVTVTATATTIIAIIVCCLFYDSNRIIVAIFLFIFNENVLENLWVAKGIGEERGNEGWFIIIRMVTAMAMAMVTV
jgi:hypothetical protein